MGEKNTSTTTSCLPLEESSNEKRDGPSHVSIAVLPSCQVIVFRLTSNTVLVPDLQELARI